VAQAHPSRRFALRCLSSVAHFPGGGLEPAGTLNLAPPPGYRSTIEKPGLTTAGKADLPADHDLLAQALSRSEGRRICHMDYICCLLCKWSAILRKYPHLA
jgi:hypothetical protein